MVYAEAAKGFRYGGANQPVPTATPAAAAGNIPQKCLYDLQQYGYSAAPLTFGPDSLWDYTVGEKAKLDGGRMTFNADANYIRLVIGSDAPAAELLLLLHGIGRRYS